MRIQDLKGVRLGLSCGTGLQVLDQRRDILTQRRAIVHNSSDVSTLGIMSESEVPGLVVRVSLPPFFLLI